MRRSLLAGCLLAANVVAAPPELLTQPNDSPLVTFRILFRAGAAFDDEGKEGAAALTAAMLSKAGTKDKSYDEIVEALSGFEDVAWTGLADAGVKHIKWITGGDWLAMMRLPVTTTALIEYGYLTNASEAELFATDAYLTAAADATADGIEAYLDTDRTGTGFIAAPRVYPASPGNLRALRCTDTALQ